MEKVVGDDGALLRRLVFLSAPHLVQVLCRHHSRSLTLTLTLTLSLTLRVVQAECRVLEGDVVDLAHLVERAHPLFAALLFAFPKFLVPNDHAAALKALPRVKVPLVLIIRIP